MTTTHTPGPWEVASGYDRDGGQQWVTSVAPGGVEMTVKVGGNTKRQNIANARLIADAPAMRTFIEQIARMTPDGECTNEDHAREDGGLDCDGGREGCKPFDMTSDDAVETLGGLIDEARGLIR